jgi:hypothetical protein
MLVIENSWSPGSPPNPAAALLKSGVVAAGWRQSHRPVLSRRPKRGSASAGETAESRGLSFKSRRDIGISKR